MNKLQAVGLGPGRKNLLSSKVINILKTSDVVYLLAKRKAWMFDMIASITDVDKIRLYYPKSIKWGEMENDEIHKVVAKEMFELLRSEKNVVFACAGDVSTFSPFSYLVKPLQNLNVQWKMVSAVSFFNAVSMVINEPLAKENDRLLMMKLHDVSEIDKYCSCADVLVLYDAHNFTKYEIEKIQTYARNNRFSLACAARFGLDDSYSKKINLLNSDVEKISGIIVLKK